MAFTNAWSTVIPAGSAAANTADDQIRQLRLDIQERMNEVVGDWTLDPVIKSPWRHWSMGNSSISAAGTRVWATDVTANGEALIPGFIAVNDMHWFLPLLMYPGTTLTDVTIRIHRTNTTAQVKMIVRSLDCSTDPLVLASLTGLIASSLTGLHDLSSGVLSEVVSENKAYYLNVILAPDGTTANTARLLGYKWTAR